MELVVVLNRVKQTAFQWRSNLSVRDKIVLAILFAVVTGLLAQVRLPLPWSPVPITGQTFAVLMAGVMLGRWWGGVSMGIYALMGFIGLPWFSGATAGVGATTGYIIGFIPAALFIGYMTDRFSWANSLKGMLALMVVANLGLIYLPGLIWLNLWMKIIVGPSLSLGGLLAIGAIPFIAGDLTKAVVAALFARVITPKLTNK
jgi:biotin transport system substrate-specific component